MWSIWSVVDELAEWGIYIVIGLGILAVAVWIIKGLVSTRARIGGPESGGWRPPGRH